jgi:uncharacterized protein
MLLRFSVSNFASFKEEITLNMKPTSSGIMREHIIIDEQGKRTDALPIAAIYGANASGKSNLVKALEYARQLILLGTRPDSATGVKPHLLDPSVTHTPSRFEFVFKHDGVVYTYGFVVSAYRVHEEWLFGYYSSKESKIFERVTEEGRTIVTPGVHLRKDVKKKVYIDAYARGTRPNQLFLTEARERNIDIIKPVTHWFREHLQVIGTNDLYRSLALRVQGDEQFTHFLTKFLRLADTGISSIKCIDEALDVDTHFRNMPSDFRETLLRQMEDESFSSLYVQGPDAFFTIHRDKAGILKYVRLTTNHQRIDGKSIPFDSMDESDGTRRLMDLSPLLLDVWGRDKVFVIDELDRSLHTHLSRLFLRMCITGITSKHARGQFIVTTHDTNLLDRRLLRRDEIWLMERDKEGSSHLSNLAEYKVGEGTNLEIGYLNGRFGAIPQVGNIDEMLAEEED